MVMPRITDDNAVSPELSERPRRRKFNARERMRILDEIDRAGSTRGAASAILRRESLYSSSITDWRRQREAGAYEGLSPVKRGPKAASANPLSAEHAQLQRDYKRLEHAEAVIDIQKKLTLLLGLPIVSDGKS